MYRNFTKCCLVIFNVFILNLIVFVEVSAHLITLNVQVWKDSSEVEHFAVVTMDLKNDRKKYDFFCEMLTKKHKNLFEQGYLCDSDAYDTFIEISGKDMWLSVFTPIFKRERVREAFDFYCDIKKFASSNLINILGYKTVQNGELVGVKGKIYIN